MDEQILKLSELYSSILTEIGEDLNREGLQETPRRAAQVFRYLTHGYKLKLEDVVNGAVFSCDNNDMVVIKDVEVSSICDHHLLPVVGKCHIGLSKIPRIVDMYARRLQIQEKLTKQIAHALMDSVDARGVGVIIKATHMCMITRGIEERRAVATTSSMLGTFEDDISVREEFYNLLKQ